jgi:hypothetical protein
MQLAGSRFPTTASRVTRRARDHIEPEVRALDR